MSARENTTAVRLVTSDEAPSSLQPNSRRRPKRRMSSVQGRGALVQHVADLAAPMFADACGIDLLTKRGEFVRGAEAPVLGAVPASIDLSLRTKSWGKREGRAEILPPLGAADASIIVVPVVVQRRVRGRIVFLSRSRRFNELDLATAESFARCAGAALENAKLRRAERELCRGCEQVLGTVAHDLRNPLSIIQASISLLREEAEDSVTLRRLGAVERATVAMNSLVTDLLDISSARAGVLRVEPKLERAAAVVDDALGSFGLLTGRRGILLAAEHEDPEALVYCDRARVLQVLSNLIGNAMKFSQEGSSITIATSAEDHRTIRFSVIDTGCGIAEPDLANVFGRFWSGRREDGVSRGLGLAIAKSIVEAHGGTIGAVSSPDKGSTFWFTLPATAPASCPVPRL